MIDIEIKTNVLIENDDFKIHYIGNCEESIMICASDLESFFKVNVSEFLESDRAKFIFQCLLDKTPRIVEGSENGKRFKYSVQHNRSIDDVILYYEGKFYLQPMLFYAFIELLPVHNFIEIESIVTKKRIELCKANR
jgi:hypothetical protein